MDKNQLKQLRETAKRLNEIQLAQISGLQIPQISETLIQNLVVPSLMLHYDFSHLTRVITESASRSIDLPSVVEAIASIISQIDFTPLYVSQIQAIQNSMKLIVESQSFQLSQIRASGLLSSALLKNLKGITSLQESFAVKLSESIANILYEFQENPEIVGKKLEELADSETQKQPSIWIQREIRLFIISIIINLIISVGVSEYYSNSSNEVLNKNFQKTNFLIENSFSEIIKVCEEQNKKIGKLEKDQGTHYVAHRKVEIKTKPSFKSQTIVTIYPNQKVRMVKKQHKWIYIEYFDYIDGVPKTGWASKKYLVKMN